MNSSHPTSPRDERLAREAEALWRELYDEAPPKADATRMLDMICSGLPQVGYDRLRDPHLRPTTITYPRGR